MKSFYAFICAVVLLNICCYETLAHMNEKFRDECIQELKLNADETELIKADKYITKEKKTAPKNIQCYSLCYFKKLGIIDNKTELNGPLFATLVADVLKGDQALIKATMEKCKLDATIADSCERVFNFEVCVRGQM